MCIPALPLPLINSSDSVATKMNTSNEHAPDKVAMLSYLTVKEILTSLRGHVTFSNHVRNNKQQLVQHVLEHTPPQQLQDLLGQAQLK